MQLVALVLLFGQVPAGQTVGIDVPPVQIVFSGQGMQYGSVTAPTGPAIEIGAHVPAGHAVAPSQTHVVLSALRILPEPQA